jgi:hypothetical protein
MYISIHAYIGLTGADLRLTWKNWILPARTDWNLSSSMQY